MGCSMIWKDTTMTTDVKRRKYKNFNKENASKKKRNHRNLSNSLKRLQNHFNDKYHSK